MQDLKFAFRQLLKNPGFTIVPLASLPWFLRAVAGGDFHPSDQGNIHYLVIIRHVVAVNEHLKSTRSYRDEILMFHKQAPTVGRVNHKRPKRARVKQLPDFIRIHAAKHTSTLFPRASRETTCGASI